MKRVLGCLAFAAAAVACGGGLGSTLPFMCEANPGATGLEVLCAQTEKAIVTNPRPDPRYVHTQEEDYLLVPLLNQLYGVRPLDARP